MNLMERLQAAVQKGREAAGQGFSPPPISLEEEQSRLRRKMRVRTRRLGPAMPVFVSVAGQKPAAAPEPSARINNEPAAPAEAPEEEQVA